MSTSTSWSDFIDLAEMRCWYSELPGGQAVELARYRKRDEDIRPYPDFADFRRRTISLVDASIQPFQPAMHNPKLHFRLVERNGMAAAHLYAKRFPGAVPSAVLQNFSLALYSHDAGHCGCTFRKDAPRGLFMPQFGIDRSVEWVTSFAVNDFMARQGVPLPARIFQTGVHWASTFGGKTSEGRRLRLPVPEPRTIWGAIMRAADISPAPERTISHWFRRSVAVNYGEVPAIPVPKTWDDYVESEVNFNRYCVSTIDHLDAVAGFDLSKEMGWREQFALILQSAQQLRDRRCKLAVFVQRLQRSYGVVFP